jgi:hypothetical protein
MPCQPDGMVAGALQMRFGESERGTVSGRDPAFAFG